MPMYVRMLASTALFGLLLSGATALAQLPTKPVLTLEAAKKLAAAAEEEAVKNKWNMVILTSCKNFEICRIDAVVTIIYGFKLCFSAFLLSGGQASECPHLASCSSRAQLRSQF